MMPMVTKKERRKLIVAKKTKKNRHDYNDIAVSAVVQFLVGLLLLIIDKMLNN